MEHSIGLNVSVFIPLQASGRRFPSTKKEQPWHIGVDPVDKWFQTGFSLLLFFCYFFPFLLAFAGGVYGERGLRLLRCVGPLLACFFGDRFCLIPMTSLCCL